MLVINASIQIPDSELELSYARSSGPGGQNVNKVNSKAVLRFNVRESAAFDESTRSRLLARLGPRLTLDGSLIIASDRYRDQTRNREDCFEKLRQALVAAMAVPKIRKPTKPTRGSIRRTQERKKKDSAKKGLRRRPVDYD